MVVDIKLVKPGSVMFEYREDCESPLRRIKGRMGPSGGSNVVLIKGEESNLLVDTGFDGGLTKRNLVLNLKRLDFMLDDRAGLHRGDVENVFITHWHLDHYGLLPYFENADIYVSSMSMDRFGPNALKELAGEGEVKEIGPGEKIMDGVVVVRTPGHTADHCSLMADYEGDKVLIAGDAVVSLSWFDAGETWSYNSDFHSGKDAKKTIQMITRTADFIIPGHGVPFQNWKKG